MTAADRPDRIDVIAHRGASADAPENTFAAFEEAIAQGADWIELDCSLCASGEVVVMHDDTVDRTTNGTGEVAAHTLEQLRLLDAGSWMDAAFADERIPLLVEVLERMAGQVGVYIEIKAGADIDNRLDRKLLEAAGNGPMTGERADSILKLIDGFDTPSVALTRAVIREVHERGMTDVVVLQSFSPVVTGLARLSAPDLRVEQLTWSIGPFAVKPQKGEHWASLLGLYAVNGNLPWLTDARMAALKAEGRRIGAWPINHVQSIRELAAGGVDHIITDHPAMCIRELAALGRR